MKIKLYDETDIRCSDAETNIDGAYYRFRFLSDVPGDNPDTLGDMDNHTLSDRLQRFGAIGENDKLDCEACCFDIYFESKNDGTAFVSKLNEYLSRKSLLLREAEAL